jgi:hypothetical protein
VIAETLVAQAENVQKAVTVLCEAAGRGDLAAAKALLPYLDQALGKPMERHELRAPSSVDEIEQLSTEELERLVAQGRARRLGLQVPPEPAEEPADVDGLVRELPANTQVVDVHALGAG